MEATNESPAEVGAVKCTHCGASSFRKVGRRNGRQTYFCKSCEREFTGARDMPAEPEGTIAPKVTRVAAPAASKSSGKGLDGEINKTELKRLLAAIYNIPGQLGVVDTTFEESEFAASSDQLVDMVDRLPALRIILRVLSPLVGAADLIGKARRLVESFQAKQAAKQAARGANGSEPSTAASEPTRLRFPNLRR